MQKRQLGSVYNHVLIVKGGRPDKKRAIASKVSNTRVKGLPRTHTNVMMALWNGVSSPISMTSADIRKHKKRSLLPVSSENRDQYALVMENGDTYNT